MNQCKTGRRGCGSGSCHHQEPAVAFGDVGGAAADNDAAVGAAGVCCFRRVRAAVIVVVAREELVSIAMTTSHDLAH